MEASDDKLAPAASMERLPGEVLARIFSALDTVELNWVELVCCTFRTVVVQHELWRQACGDVQSTLVDLTADIDLNGVPIPKADCHRLSTEAVTRSAFFKRLYCHMNAPQARESLIASACCATSTDHPQESIDHLLSPAARSSNLLCYWSSAGSEDEDSVEVLSFVLAHPLCLVREVDIRPFRAFFQREKPIYSSKAVRFRLGGLDCFDQDGTQLPRAEVQLAISSMMDDRAASTAPGAGQLEAPGLGSNIEIPGGVENRMWAVGGLDPNAGPDEEEFGPQHAVPEAVVARRRSQAAQVQQLPACVVWESESFPVEQADELQRFEFEPTLCVGGLLQVELIGKVQRQEPDHLLYVCLAYVRALGVPLYNFRIVPAPAVESQGHPATPSSSQPQASKPTLYNSQGLPSLPLPPAACASENAVEPWASGSVSHGVEVRAVRLPDQHQQQQEQLQQDGETPLQMKYLAHDPLKLAGGLAMVSEAGRVWHLRRMLAERLVAGYPPAGGQREGREDEEMWSGPDLESEDGGPILLEDMDWSETSSEDSDVDWDAQPFAD